MEKNTLEHQENIEKLQKEHDVQLEVEPHIMPVNTHTHTHTGTLKHVCLLWLLQQWKPVGCNWFGGLHLRCECVSLTLCVCVCVDALCSTALLQIRSSVPIRDVFVSVAVLRG